MTDDRRDNYNDDEHFQRKCEAAIGSCLLTAKYNTAATTQMTML
jgi:hypothetical protein